MKIPYTKLELHVALLGINEEQFDDEEKLEKIKKDFEEITPKNQAELNKKIAEFHGVSLKDLIDSPNYRVLVEAYREDAVQKFINMLTEKLGLTKKQAWAVLACMMGLLD